jgi:acetyltransferase-like isoleucine patch superfamily enzyme
VIDTSAGKSVEHINKLGRLRKLLRGHPLEWIRLFSTVWSTIKYRYIFRCAGQGTIIGGKTGINNFTRVKIGKRCLIQDQVYMRAGADGYINLGDQCAINSFAKLFGHGGIDVGANTQLGPGVTITTTTHDFRKTMRTEFRQVKIGQWAWVGANAVILPGIATLPGSSARMKWQKRMPRHHQ